MQIELTGKNGEGVTALIDAEDEARVRAHGWWLHKYGYPCTRINGQAVQMHRFIMEAPARVIVDHINMIRTDNRKANLRFATFSQNLSNSGPRNGRKYKGVYHEKSGRPKCWHAYATVNNKLIDFGRHYSEDEAARVYDREIVKYRGEFARLNFPKT